ncbi:MAG: hypothetical protein FJX76_14180 [Armatimonadetes bacterium]|nr:hypothetical protein [Armatimonadota bacterium]
MLDLQTSETYHPTTAPAPEPLAPLPPLGPAPDWSTREWSRPIIHFAHGDNPNLVAVCDFKYHGIKVRGVRLFRSDKDKLSVVMPQKKYGDAIQNAVYFLTQEDRETFQADVTWAYLYAQSRTRRRY